MDRRLVAGIATTVAMVLLVLAASSGPVRLWVVPPLEVRPPTIDNTAGPLVTVAPPVTVPPEGAAGHWGDTLLQLVGVALLGLLVAMIRWVVKGEMWPTLRRSGARRRRGPRISALPEIPERELAVDVDAARAALAGGTPRNAIVACWMQLERDVADAGLPRHAAETSAEYVERVVAASSVEPRPIRELAALYREARFSRHELGDDHRARALAALNSVEAALRSSVKVVV